MVSEFAKQLLQYFEYCNFHTFFQKTLLKHLTKVTSSEKHTIERNLIYANCVYANQFL